MESSYTIDPGQLPIDSIDRLDFWPLARLDSTLVNGDRLDRLFSWQFSPTSCCMNCVRCEAISRSCSHVGLYVADRQTKAFRPLYPYLKWMTLRILTVSSQYIKGLCYTVVSWTVVPHLLFLHPPKRLCYYVNTTDCLVWPWKQG